MQCSFEIGTPDSEESKLGLDVNHLERVCSDQCPAGHHTVLQLGTRMVHKGTCVLEGEGTTTVSVLLQ